MSPRVFATFVFLLGGLAGAQVTREALVRLAHELERLPENSSPGDAAPYFADLPAYSTKTSSAKLVPTALLTTGLSVERGVPVVLLANTLEMMRSSRQVETEFGSRPVQKQPPCKLLAPKKATPKSRVCGWARQAMNPATSRSCGAFWVTGEA